MVNRDVLTRVQKGVVGTTADGKVIFLPDKGPSIPFKHKDIGHYTPIGSLSATRFVLTPGFVLVGPPLPWWKRPLKWLWWDFTDWVLGRYWIQRP